MGNIGKEGFRKKEEGTRKEEELCGNNQDKSSRDTLKVAVLANLCQLDTGQSDLRRENLN